jgi:hypothetical protein
MLDCKVMFGTQEIEIQSPTIDILLQDMVAVIINEIEERLDFIEEEFSASCESDEDYWINRAAELVTLRDHVRIVTQFSELTKFDLEELLDMTFKISHK